MKEKIIDFLATGFYSGLSPKAPGTMGTLAALAVALVLANTCSYFLTPIGGFVTCLLLIVLSLIIVHLALSNKHFKNNPDDPQAIVLDEFAGFFTTIAFVPPTPTNLLLAFLLFRFFDITKLPPIKAIERLPGTFGIVLDDIAAGIYANILLQVIIRLA